MLHMFTSTSAGVKKKLPIPKFVVRSEIWEIYQDVIKQGLKILLKGEYPKPI